MAKKAITVEALKKYVRKEASKFLKQSNITSVGIGYKITKEKPTKELSIQFTVGNKVAPEALESIGATEIPKVLNVNGVDVPTDVLERTYDSQFREVNIESKLEAASPRKIAINPISPGVSVGNPRTKSAGTVGCVVYDANSGSPYILSNWHVLNGPTGVIGDTIVQPGSYDDNRVNQNVVGHLIRSYIGIAGDCAIASIDNRRLSADIVELGVAVERIAEPELGDKVVKSGRTTSVTFGIVKRVHVTTRINYDQIGDVEIGCLEIGPDDDHPAVDGEISMVGDSGSVWMAIERSRPSNVMVGLHFAGETGDSPEHSLACYPSAVFEKLGIRPKPLESIPEDAHGLGYSSSFLGVSIPYPQAANKLIRNDLLAVEGKVTFDYMHFSLAMSRERKFARWVAWNIDGGSLHRLSRNGIVFKKDPKIPANAQIGNELYTNNDLDRGHIARRSDLLWGSSSEAKRANLDSFFFTNISPQHKAFNQSGAMGIWGELENAIYADVDIEDLKISVMGGPIFSENDPEYRGVRLPKQFWKVIYFRESGSATLTVKGYVLTQSDLLNELEVLELPEFSVYEVSILRISEMTGLVLPEISSAELLTAERRDIHRREGTEAKNEVAVRRISTTARIVK